MPPLRGWEMVGDILSTNMSPLRGSGNRSICPHYQYVAPTALGIGGQMLFLPICRPYIAPTALGNKMPMHSSNPVGVAYW